MSRAGMIVSNATRRRIERQLADPCYVCLVAIPPVFKRHLHRKSRLMAECLPYGYPFLTFLAEFRNDLGDSSGKGNLAAVDETKQCGSSQLLGQRHDRHYIVDPCCSALALVRLPYRLMHYDLSSAGDNDDRAIGNSSPNIVLNRRTKEAEGMPIDSQVARYTINEIHHLLRFSLVSEGLIAWDKQDHGRRTCPATCPLSLAFMLGSRKAIIAASTGLLARKSVLRRPELRAAESAARFREPKFLTWPDPGTVPTPDPPTTASAPLPVPTRQSVRNVCIRGPKLSSRSLNGSGSTSSLQGRSGAWSPSRPTANATSICSRRRRDRP